MSTVVIMPGGFHPFHAGHLTLYQSAQRAFPDAEVFVAATNDTSARPFPFAVKEKLARLAGVDAGHFVQVKSPFRAEEITSQFDPKKDVLIFVRSEKDADQPPRPGGVKKDGNPAYLQPLLGAKRLEPFDKHAYMAYLPTVEFGPGLTSATEIRAAWPTLTDRRKTALVMSLYPKTQSNAKLAQTVVGMLDAAIGGAVTEEDTSNPDTLKPALAASMSGLDQSTAANNNLRNKADPTKFDAFVSSQKKPAPPASVSENQGWAATYEETRAYGGQQGAGMTATWQRRENQPVDEDYVEEKWSAKYKRSINCANPRGFSQRAHCAGRKKNEDVAEAFGPLPKDNQQIRLGRHTVDIERVGLDNNYISFAWNDSQGQEHYEEVAVGDLGSYDDLIEKIKQEISYQERKYTDQGVAEGSTDTIYPNATVIKSKNGRPVGEIYQDENGWGFFHYGMDSGNDFIDSREDAIQGLKDFHAENRGSRPDYTIKGVAEAINPDITNPAFSHEQQIGDYLYVARYWSKGLKITAYHGAKQIGYAELMYQSAPFDDFADPKTTPKRIWLESEWTRVDPKYQRQGIMSTMYAYAKMLGNSVKPSQTRSDDAKAAWKSWRDAGDAKHLTSNEGVAEGSLEEIDRRGFLRGLGAAAVVGAAGSAMAQTMPNINAQQVELANKYYNALVQRAKEDGRELDTRTLNFLRAKAQEAAAKKFQQNNTQANAQQGFPTQGSERRVAKDAGKFESQGVEEAQLAEKCWDTHRQAGMKKKGNRMVPNCVPKESSK